MIRVRAAYSPVIVGCPCFAERARSEKPEEEGATATAGRPAVGAEPTPAPLYAAVITGIIIASAATMMLFAG